MRDWLAISLRMVSEIGRERLVLAQQEVALRKRRDDLDRLEPGLKSLLEVAIETSGDHRARAQYERICRVVSQGGDPSVKINKTRLMLELLKENPERGLTIMAIQEALGVQGVEVSRNYIQTVMHQLSTKRGLVTKTGDSFLLTEQGRELADDPKQQEKKRRRTV